MSIKPLEIMASLKACMGCGACFRQQFDACPINVEFGIPPYSFTSIAFMADAIFEGILQPSRELAPVPFSCTLCGFCATHCITVPLHFKWSSPTGLVEGIRSLFIESASVPTKVSECLNNLALFGNPWGVSSSAKVEWEKECKAPIPDFAKNRNEYLLFVGDAAFIDETKSVIRSVAELLHKAGIDFGTLKEKEVDSGNTARELGEYGLFEELAKKNIRIFQNYGVRKLIVISPHDYHVLLVDYPKLGFEFEAVYHYTQLLNDLIKIGRISPAKSVPKTVTYHDSCYLGRYHKIFEPPREIIKAMLGVRFIEMKQSFTESFCCGGGGGRMWYDVPEEPMRKRIPNIRVTHAKEVEADVIATACPYCKSMLMSADNLGEIAIKDVAELLAESVSI
jgi:Fe-S oxidoreductase